MVTIRSLLAGPVVLVAAAQSLFVAPQTFADPNAPDLLLTSSEAPEGYGPQPGSVDQALGALTTVRDWMFGGGAQIDPPTCNAELTWFVKNLIPNDSAVDTLWGPQILLIDGVGRGAHPLGEFDEHIATCQKIRVTSGAVILDATLEPQAPPQTVAGPARGFKETVTFTLGAFQQTRVLIGLYGSVGDVAALVIGGSRDLDPGAVSTEALVAVAGDVYARQIDKIDKARPATPK